MLKYEFGCELNYTIEQASTLIFNIAIVNNNYQIIVEEYINTNPRLKIEEYITYSEKNRYFRLNVSPGNLQVSCGEGEDQFWIAQAEFTQTPHLITDFEDNIDVIGIGGDLGFVAADVGINQDGADVVITAGNNEMARVLGINAALLTAADVSELNAILIT